MEQTGLSRTVKNITRLILTSHQKMMKKDDLENIVGDLDFDTVINLVYENLRKLGFELIKTKFLDQIYYILTTEGINDDLTPSQYGILALILALSKEFDDNLKVVDLKSILSEVWENDVDELIRLDYIRKINIEGYEIIKVTPIGKATMKNVINDLKIDSLLSILEDI